MNPKDQEALTKASVRAAILEEVKRLARGGKMLEAILTYRQNIHDGGHKQARDAILELAGLPPVVNLTPSAVLSPETQRRLDILFTEDLRPEATRLIFDECGNNLPFLDKCNEYELERYRFAALKLSGGELSRLRDAVQLAKTDWRDLLVAAGFANDTQAHNHWMPTPNP